MNNDDKSELAQHLKDQLNFLRKSSSEFDRGDLSEAKRIAVVLRVLFHESKYSKSLLGQLLKAFNISPKIKGQKINTGPNLLFYSGVMIKISASGPKYVPNLDDSYPALREQTPNEWWNGLAIVVDGLTFSRKDIILYLANQDGGAHVDLKLNENYRLLTRAHILWKNYKGEDLENVEKILMREYAYFVINAIEECFKPYYL